MVCVPSVVLLGHSEGVKLFILCVCQLLFKSLCVVLELNSVTCCSIINSILYLLLVNCWIIRLGINDLYILVLAEQSTPETMYFNVAHTTERHMNKYFRGGVGGRYTVVKCCRASALNKTCICRVMYKDKETQWWGRGYSINPLLRPTPIAAFAWLYTKWWTPQRPGLKRGNLHCPHPPLGDSVN